VNFVLKIQILARGSQQNFTEVKRGPFNQKVWESLFYYKVARVNNTLPVDSFFDRHSECSLFWRYSAWNRPDLRITANIAMKLQTGRCHILNAC
jgi:hypothetical protein